MSTSLPSLAVMVLALGQTADPAPDSARVAPAQPPMADASDAPAATPGGEELLRQAVAALETHSSVRADLRFRVEALDQEMYGNGVFVQGDIAAQQFRLELRLRVGEYNSVELQVCDGKALWIHRHLPEDERPRVYRVEVDPALYGLASRRQVAGLGQFPRTPALGGLPRMLRELNAAFDFTDVKVTKLGDVPVWALRGEWNLARVGQLAPQLYAEIEKSRAGQPAKLPSQLPAYVVIYLGQDDLFPYRFDYYRPQDDAPETGAGEPMLTLELFEVRIGDTVDPRQFAYQPGDVAFEDLTVPYAQGLSAGDVE